MPGDAANTTVKSSDTGFWVANAVASVAALSLLAYILLIRGGTPEAGVDLRFMPGVNAVLNASAAALLVAGRVAIARRQVGWHRALMVAAFVASALFLVGYLAYHTVHGDTRYGGSGVLRGVYLALLASHVLLSMTVVPGCFAAFYFAWKKDFVTHTRITRFLHPVWLYVSVTGVVVYLMLRPYYGA
jgi:putative membrane protein